VAGRVGGEWGICRWGRVIGRRVLASRVVADGDGCGWTFELVARSPSVEQREQNWDERDEVSGLHC